MFKSFEEINHRLKNFGNYYHDNAIINYNQENNIYFKKQGCLSEKREIKYFDLVVELSALNNLIGEDTEDQ